MLLFTLVEFLKQEFKKLKENLKKCLDRRGKATKSGAASSILSKCRYFDQLSFLHDKASNKPTESNIVIACGEGSDTSSLPSPSSCESEVQPSVGVHKRKFSADLSSGGKNAKSRRELADNVFSMLVKILQDMKHDSYPQVHLDEDEDPLYCRSLIPFLRKLPLKKKRLAKFRINELLYKMEFDSED